jgi:uncharacterized protein
MARQSSVDERDMPTISDENDNEPPKRPTLKFRWITGQFAVCRLPADAPLPDWASTGVFTSVTRTADELSIVCLAENLPPGMTSEAHWICFKLEGPFAFSQVGILASFIDPLAAAGVPVFAISTYDTDYVLIREEFAGVALHTLGETGHELWPKDDSWRKLIE